MVGKKDLFGKRNPFFGKHHTEESKKKMRVNRPQLKGENHFNWKGGHEETIKKYALERDNKTCGICGLKDDEIMVVDHIKPKSIYPELRNKLENMMTLCPNCHARKTIREQKEIVRIKKTKI